MFAGWENYYLLTGGAAGALLGLMFVVATLGAGGQDRTASLRAASIYMTPTVVGFSVVLVVSALAEIAVLDRAGDAIAIGAIAAGGAAYGAVTLWRMLVGRGAPPHWSDHWCYGYAPFVFHLGLGGAAYAAWVGAPWAAEAVAGAVMAHLLLAIRNAWDLVTWLAPARTPPTSE